MNVLALLALADVLLCVPAFTLGLPSPSWFAAAHTILTAGAFMAVRRRPGQCEGWNTLALSLGAVAGPCGIGFLILARPWPAASAKRDPKPDVVHPAKNAEPSPPSIIARLMDQRIRFPDDCAVESLETILRHGDLLSRCKALETAVRSFEPRLSPLVATALSDPDQTVRALAAATSAQVSANLATRIARMEAQESDSIAEQYELAMLLFENGVYNVLLSHSQRVNLRTKAREALMQLLRKSHLLGDRGVAVSAALVRLGIDMAYNQGSVRKTGIVATNPAGCFA